MTDQELITALRSEVQKTRVGGEFPDPCIEAAADRLEALTREYDEPDAEGWWCAEWDYCTGGIGREVFDVQAVGGILYARYLCDNNTVWSVSEFRGETPFRWPIRWRKWPFEVKA